MAFLSPFFLLGAAAAALPILVHLVRRTRARRVQFPSLMFLRRIEQKTIRRRRLRNIVLLVMRCAALLLLALAFARPYFPGFRSSAAGPRQVRSVILLDNSYSMLYPGVLERARQAARDIVRNAGGDEKVALVLFSGVSDVLMPFTEDRGQVNAALDGASPGLGPTDYLQAIQGADSLLKDAQDAGPGIRRIYLISDFQQAGWNRSAPPVKLSPGVELIPRDVSDPQPANLAVSEVKSDPVIYSQKYPGKVLARIDDFDRRKGPLDATVELKLNDLVVERKQIKLDAGSSTTVEFTGFNVPEGSNRGSVEISADPLPLDNRYFFTITRDTQTKVLAIETATRGRSESFFIQQSLLAGENSQFSLTTKTAGSINPADLDGYRIVILNDAGNIGQGLAAALENFVEHGGGLLIGAGKHTDASDFNRALAKVSPATLGETVQTRGGYAMMSQVKTEHPIFNVFAKSGRLAPVRVYAYHRAAPSERATVVAALDDGSPLIIEGLAGRGKVVLITSSLDSAWNDLPLTPLYLPLVRQVLSYMGDPARASAYTLGQAIPIPAEPDGTPPLVDGPAGGRVEDIKRDQAGNGSLTAKEVGFYRLRYRNRTDNLAVDLDTKESDLSKLNIDELIASVSRAPADEASFSERSERPTAEQIEARQRIWFPLLVMALLLFVAEAILARRIRIAKLLG
jgi:hypothetical protein